MHTYVVRRLLALVPTLFFASLIVFVTVRLIPGDVIDLMLSQNDISADKLSRDQLIAALGLDKPMWEQYGRWAGAILFRGDFGTSLWQSTPVGELLAARLPVTFELGLLALIIALIDRAADRGLFGDPPGHRGRLCRTLALVPDARGPGVLDRHHGDGAALDLVGLVARGQIRRRSPTDPLQNLKQMLIPAFILGTALSAITMRLTRTQMLEVLRQDYIRTAWAKGLNARTVTLRHALRNALVPVVTLVGLQAPLLIGGAVIVEQIFVIPGMGLLLLDAVNQRDYPIITGVFLIVGVAVMVINLLVDLSYGLLDPRVRYR